MRCAGDGGFTSSVSGTQMITQIQLAEVPDDASIRILERREEIRAICDGCNLVSTTLFRPRGVPCPA